MFRLAICDDDPKILEEIETFIDKFGTKKIKYDVFYSAEELYSYSLQGNEYEVYLLDIEMEKMSGLKLAKLIRGDRPRALIVFLTSHAQYVYEVFDVITFDFIVKPITYKKFCHLIEKVERYFKATYSNFVFSYRKNTYSLPCDQISYIEKMGRKAFIYDINGNSYQSNMTLTEIWDQLDKKNFAQIHTSCIINLSEVIGVINEEVQLKSKIKLFISRNYRQKFKQQHLQYLKDLL